MHDAQLVAAVRGREDAGRRLGQVEVAIELARLVDVRHADRDGVHAVQCHGGSPSSGASRLSRDQGLRTIGEWPPSGGAESPPTIRSTRLLASSRSFVERPASRLAIDGKGQRAPRAQPGTESGPETAISKPSGSLKSITTCGTDVRPQTTIAGTCFDDGAGRQAAAGCVDYAAGRERQADRPDGCRWPSLKPASSEADDSPGLRPGNRVPSRAGGHGVSDEAQRRAGSAAATDFVIGSDESAYVPRAPVGPGMDTATESPRAAHLSPDETLRRTGSRHPPSATPVTVTAETAPGLRHGALADAGRSVNVVPASRGRGRARLRRRASGRPPPSDEIFESLFDLALGEAAVPWCTDDALHESVAGAGGVHSATEDLLLVDGHLPVAGGVQRERSGMASSPVISLPSLKLALARLVRRMRMTPRLKSVARDRPSPSQAYAGSALPPATRGDEDARAIPVRRSSRCNPTGRTDGASGQIDDDVLELLAPRRVV